MVSSLASLGTNNVWPSFRGDTSNSGSSSAVGSTTSAMGWKFCTGGEVFSTPTVDSAFNVYFASYDSKLYSYTAAGIRRWARALPSKASASSALSADGSVVYTSSEDGTLSAFSTDTGTALWTYKACGNIYSGATVAADGTIYITSFLGGGNRQCGNAYMYAVRPADGSVKWSAKDKYSYGSTSTPALSADGTRVYVMWFLDVLLAFDASNGAIRLMSNGGSSSGTYNTASPAVNPVSGDIYAMNFEGVLTAYTNVSLSPRWTSSARLQKISSTDITSSAAVSADGTFVYIGGTSETPSAVTGAVYSINARTGGLRWTYRTGGGVFSSPIVDTVGKVFVGSYDGFVYALTPPGALAWRYPTGGSVQGSASLNAQGQVLIGSSDRCMYSFVPSQSAPPSFAPTGPSNAPTLAPSKSPVPPTVAPSPKPAAAKATATPTTTMFTLIQVTLIVTGISVTAASTPAFQAHLYDVVAVVLNLNQNLAQVVLVAATPAAIAQTSATQLVFQVYTPNANAHDLGMALVNAMANGEFAWWLNSEGYFALNTYGTAAWVDLSATIPSAAPTSPGHGSLWDGSPGGTDKSGGALAYAAVVLAILFGTSICCCALKMYVRYGTCCGLRTPIQGDFGEAEAEADLAVVATEEVGDTNRHLINPGVPVATASATLRVARAAPLFPSPRRLNVLGSARDLARRLSSSAASPGGRYVSGDQNETALTDVAVANLDAARLPRATPAPIGTATLPPTPPHPPGGGGGGGGADTAAIPTVTFAQAFNAGLDYDCIEIDARFIAPTSARAVTVMPRIIDGDTPRTVDGVPVAGVGIGGGAGATRLKPRTPPSHTSRASRSSIRTSAREVPVVVARPDDGDEGETKTDWDP